MILFRYDEAKHFQKIYRYIEKWEFILPKDFASIEDGHYIIKVNEAIEKSAKEGRWIDIES